MKNVQHHSPHPLLLLFSHCVRQSSQKMGKKREQGGGMCWHMGGCRSLPPLLVGGGSVINRAYSSSFRKVQKNFRPYMAIFQQKKCKFARRFSETV